MKNTSKLICTLSLLICLGAAMTANGQNTIRFGITGGLNASDIKTSFRSDILWKYNAGISFAKELSGNFSLASELVYSSQGRRLILNRPEKYITHLDYIAIPVLVRFRPDGKNLFIQAGGKFSVLTNSREIHTNSNNISSTNDINHLRQWDAGAVGGLGYWLGSHMVVDVRYYYGLAPLIKKHTVLGPDLTPIFYGAPKWFNRVWSLNLTYYL